jgi:hypothetical protein
MVSILAPAQNLDPAFEKSGLAQPGPSDWFREKRPTTRIPNYRQCMAQNRYSLTFKIRQQFQLVPSCTQTEQAAAVCLNFIH